MNKQEFINNLERFEAFYKKESKNDFYKGKCEAYSTVLDLAREVKILQQPVVKPFVRDWFEDHEDDLDNHIFDYIREWKDQDKDSDFYKWFNESDNESIETLIRMKDGYEVEKEPLYIVSLPVYNESMSAYDSVVEDYVIVDENFNDELDVLRFELTEKEIKFKDERYWPFAVPVEEVAEE